MHPTMNQMLVQDRHATLHAEAEAARLAAIARSRTDASGSTPARHERAPLDVVRRVVHRLVPA
jgi:hypothetical protein